MTLRELNEMAARYGLSPDLELKAQPLQKDPERKVTFVSPVPGALVLHCSRISEKKR